MYNEKLVELKKKIIEFASLIEAMIHNSVTGLLQRDLALLEGVIHDLEPRANDSENEIDEMCTSLIAQFQPAAKDLRTILMVYRMNSDLERMGDHAVNIAESAMFLIERPNVKPFIDLPKMNELVTKMVTDSITSFINEDVALARSIGASDAAVDELKDKSSEELIECMVKDPETVERAMHLSRVLGNLERIADLSTNIGEDVAFMVAGLVTKHHKNEINPIAS
jgi:phosphate transport system protein